MGPVIDPPTGLRPVAWGAVILVVVILQGTLLAFAPSSWAAPDLVTVLVLALAHHRGAFVGGMLGAWAGLVLDLVPPVTGPFGGWTLVLGAAGALHGHVVATRRPGPLLSLGLLGITAGLVCVGHAATLWFVGIPVPLTALARATVGSALWAWLLAPPVLLLTRPRGAVPADADLTVQAPVDLTGSGR
jgi:cell shape-determining protein MreD